jgi:hypothetical protein
MCHLLKVGKLREVFGHDAAESIYDLLSVFGG